MIINADDFGYSAEVNEAVSECFRAGVINRATIMVNMPGAEEAARIARENGFFDRVGLHINLTEGKALTDECAASELCDAVSSKEDKPRDSRRDRGADKKVFIHGLYASSRGFA